MVFPARVFRILIASPSDVIDEREIAVKIIQEWNDLNSAERQLVLLPLRWETHSAPEYGQRPQAIINRQVVDNCDILVGIFWTRIGTPTGLADSGTLEEIERVASDGKTVMLYFSQMKQDPEKIDIEQLAKLRDFKKKTFPNALVEGYSSHIEFRDKLAKQIEIQIRTLIAGQSDGEEEFAEITPKTDIVIHFADELGTNMGSQLEIETAYCEVMDFENIPDYVQTGNVNALARPEGVSSWLSYVSSNVNKDYYRQMATHIIQQSFYKPLRFWLKNRGGVGARDVYIDITLQSEKGNVILIPRSQCSSSTPTQVSSSTLLGGGYSPNNPDEVIRDGRDVWNTNIEIRALQPQRELSPSSEVSIGAKESCEILIRSRIFADTLPEPVIQELKLKIKVNKFIITAADMMHMITDLGNKDDSTRPSSSTSSARAKKHRRSS
ncbi:MAG: hypothetical protein FDZ69_12070 [Deltaproteobacteria bacterium]|nr:MAG: hypothetical protein FDZ69_12070 [Deltaproteobacteria bacterium]